MKEIKEEIEKILMPKLHAQLITEEDMFNVESGYYYYDVLFPVKEKLKFKLVDVITVLPYDIEIM